MSERGATTARWIVLAVGGLFLLMVLYATLVGPPGDYTAFYVLLRWPVVMFVAAVLLILLRVLRWRPQRYRSHPDRGERTLRS